MRNLLSLACATSLMAQMALMGVSAVAGADVLPKDVIKQETPKPEPKSEPKSDEKKADDKKADSKEKDAKKKKKKKSDFKKYSDVITKKAKTMQGIITTHLVGGKVYFEIAEDKFGKEFVWQVKAAGRQTNTGTISDDLGRAYVIFERAGDYIYLRGRDYSVVVEEGSPEESVVAASDLDAVLAKFKIVTFGEKKTPVIDVSAAFLGGVKELLFTRSGKMDKKTALIKNVKAFERNVEARVLGKFSVKRRGSPKPENVTVEVRHSLMALPDQPMKPRFYDKRVGYFDARYSDYSGMKNKVETFRYIKRWRLEKKDPSAAVSEPKKPITWYVDRGTPKRFIEAVREGIEFWQPAFEQAGFKNGIVAKMAPTMKEDPDWDPEDARYAVIRWVPSGIPNAQGPHVADPRTGEILEADVRMYHNVIKLIEEWYFAQAGATDPRAKKLPLPDDVMSDLVRFVVAHEVGHSLGLHHNMLGSNAYTVEQLRDPKFVAKFGVASSIMDYARFNYVMQPEDGISPIDYVAGPYDNFAIEWGYKEFDGDKTAAEEVAGLNKIADRQLSDKRLRWDAYSVGSRLDPRIQTEDIGNNAVEATKLGLKNLERVMGNLVEAATYEDGKGYDEVANSYRALASQYAREVGHVSKYVGGIIYRRELAQGHADTDVYSVYPIDEQKEAMQFLADNVFTLPKFWQNEEVLKRVGYDYYMDTVTRIGTRPFGYLLRPSMIDNQFKLMAAGKTVYSPIDIFSDLTDAVFSEVKDRKPDVSGYRRAIQASLVDRMINALGPQKEKSRTSYSTDYKALTRATLKGLQKDLTRAGNKAKSSMSGMHFLNLAADIEAALDQND